MTIEQPPARNPVTAIGWMRVRLHRRSLQVIHGSVQKTSSSTRGGGSPTVTTLRFRVTNASPTASLISQLRRLTAFSISDIRDRVATGRPLIELTPFRNTWREDRAKLVDLANRIETGELPLAVTEVYDDETESPISPIMLRNLIAHFRDIELQTQRDTMLEIGEIEDPSQFQPYDDDWTQ